MNRKNPYSDDNARASEHLRLALLYLTRHGIPPSPLNYRLGYDSISGSNEELRKALETLLAEPGTPSEEALWDIYQRYFTQDEKALDAIRQELRRVILSVQKEFEVSGGNLSVYAGSLSRFAGLLDSSDPSDDLLVEVEKVIEDTRAMEQSQKQLNSQIFDVLNEVSELRRELDQLKEEALTDALTGISNRKAFDAALEQAILSSRDNKTPFSVLVADIDHFKKFNDSHGHLVGDKVLRFVASTLKRCTKGRDMVARFGGEEFAVILPQTSLSGAHAVAEQIRRTVSAGKLRKKSDDEVYGNVTISIGATQFYASDMPSTLIDRADRALYRAKNRGRNRVEKAEWSDAHQLSV